MNTISFNLAGSCVIRDIFGLRDNDAGYEIRHFSNFFSPFYLFEKGLDVDEEAFWKSDTPNLRSYPKRSVLLDVTRRSLDAVIRDRADYLLLDTTNLRCKYFEFENGCRCYATEKNFFEKMAELSIFPRLKQVLGCDHLNRDEMRRRLKKYAELILSAYRPEQIILFHALHSCTYWNREDGGLYHFRDRDTLSLENYVMDFGFECLREFLQGCHVIEMPDGMFGDSEHKWGRHPLHFTREFYDYGLSAIETILKNLPRKEEENALEKLRQEYSTVCLKRRSQYVSYLTLPKKLQNSPGRILARTLCNGLRLLYHIFPGSLKNAFKKKYRRLQSMLIG